jgi:hypothetical protein
VLPDNATAMSGTWTVVPVLANDAGTACHIDAVSEPLAGGKVIILTDAAGTDTIKYLSRAGFTGTDTFNYTTAAGTARVLVSVTAGSCAGSKCGLLGSCQAGKCSCAPDSGMLPMFVSNPDAVARAATPKVPACRYPGEWPQCSEVRPTLACCFPGFPGCEVCRYCADQWAQQKWLRSLC